MQLHLKPDDADSPLEELAKNTDLRKKTLCSSPVSGAERSGLVTQPWQYWMCLSVPYMEKRLLEGEILFVGEELRRRQNPISMALP